MPRLRAPCSRSRWPAGVLAQELARVVAALADLLAVVGVPGARLFDDLGVHAHVDDLALAADAFAEQDVELGGLERGETLFLTTLTLVSLPMASSPFLMVPVRRMSRRTEA
jgi:hypothetical protein